MDAINWNTLLGPTTKKKKKKVKRKTVSKSGSKSNSPVVGAPITLKRPKTPTPKSPSKHNSYLTAGTIGSKEIRHRIQSFIDAFFQSHEGKTLTVDELVNRNSMIDVLKFMKPLPAANKAKGGKILGAGAFGNALQHEDPGKIIKVIKFYDALSRIFYVQPLDIIMELLIQYILQLDTEKPNMVPAVYEIYYDKGMHSIWIVMEKMDKTIDEVFEGERGTVSLRTFKDLISQVLEMLIYLNQVYGFVHRDLNGNNIMVKSEKVGRMSLRGKADTEETVNRVRFIDFGFSAMNFEGLRLGSTHSFKNDSPCRGRQDVTFLFVYFNGMADKFDAKVRGFLSEILEPVSHIKSWSFAYNRDGKLLACPSTKILDPAKALRKLENTV